MDQNTSSKTVPEQRRRRLLGVRINYWPQPAGQAALSRKWLHWICNDLATGLDVERWSVNPPFRRPNQATSGTPKNAAATEGTPYCWIDSIDYGTCEVGGEEVPCRIEHWVCDDGTCYDQEVHTAMMMTRPTAPTEEGEAAGGG